MRAETDIADAVGGRRWLNSVCMAFILVVRTFITASWYHTTRMLYDHTSVEVEARISPAHISAVSMILAHVATVQLPRRITKLLG